MLALILAMALQPFPNIEGRCSYGEITQSGPVVTISGGQSWSARGSFQADGKLQLIWRHESDRLAFGVYELKDGILVGQWGWQDEANLERDGTLTGKTMPEAIWRHNEEPPQF